jgi:hypothetical protein
MTIVKLFPAYVNNYMIILIKQCENGKYPEVSFLAG